jgi:hypothetical protein
MCGNWQRNSTATPGQYFNFPTARGDQETIEQTLELTDEEKSLGLTR